MSDRDLDLEFKATNKSLRPQSQLARAFADQLNDVFLLDETLDKLDRNINRKKQSVSYQSSELALLEARIKNAEKLLEEKKAHLQRGGGVAGGAGGSSNGNNHNSSNIPDYSSNPGSSATPATPEAAMDQQKKKKEKKDVAAQDEGVEEELAGEMDDGIAARADTSKPDEYVVVDRVQEKAQAYLVRPPLPPPTVPAAI